MKKILFLLPVILIFSSCLIYIPVPYDDDPYRDEGYYEDRYYDDYDWDVSYFYDQLAPHGYWVYHSPYGYVWLPRVDRYGWRPYTFGHWIWTDYGWMWASRFEWGWIPFHYGRWGWDHTLGWFWVPGTDWAPAWVAWRSSSLYIGWAPLPPDILFIRGRGIHSIPFSLYDNYWIFVSHRYFFDDYLYLRILPLERNRTIINITSLRSKIYERNGKIVNEGLDVEDVEKVLRRKVTKVILEDAEKPGRTRIRADSVKIFKPEIQENTGAKPEMVFDNKQAIQEINRYQTERRSELPEEEREYRLEESQKHEIKLLEESHKRELEEIEEQLESKQKIEIDKEKQEESSGAIEIRMNDLKKKHKAEKSKIITRHSTEKKKVKKKDDKNRD